MVFSPAVRRKNSRGKRMAHARGCQGTGPSPGPGSHFSRSLTFLLDDFLFKKEASAMRQRAIGWMILCFVLALAPAAWSAEPATAPAAPDAGGFLGSSCATASSEPYLFFV